MTDINSQIERMKSGEYHIGHLFLDRMKLWDPEDICTIDAGTGETETYGSMLSRSIHLARCMQALGLQPGDILALAGNNHVDLRIPFYAAMLNGLPVTALDPHYRYVEIRQLFKLTEPKIAFCQQDAYDLYTQAAKDLGIEVKIFTFDGDETSMARLMASYEKESLSDFKPPVFDTNKVYAWLVSTSGTTGVPKLAAIRHYEAAKQSVQFLNVISTQKSKTFSVSTVQWISGYCTILGVALLNWTLVQTSQPGTVDHIIDIINEHKPTSLVPTPTLLALILKSEKKCDLTSLKSLVYGGASTHKEIIKELKQRLSSDAVIRQAYGQTEVVGLAAATEPDTPVGSCGKPFPQFTFKLVDPTTETEITEPRKTGELWMKGPSFAEYYKNPEETLAVITEDGWIKTGDLLYRDENLNYYFVERMKMLIKFQNHQVIPLEIEELILSLEGVKEVCVTGIPHEVDSEHPVACVARQPGYYVTAQEIKDLVANNLTDSKRLRGGVVFMDELPKTLSGKLARGKLKEFALHAHKTQLVE